MTRRATQVGLVGFGLLALSMTGIPFFLHAPERADVLSGVVVDGRGFGVEGASVYLFSEDDQSLIAETLTDGDGDFEFQLEAERPRVYVRPSEEEGLLAAWSLPCEELAPRLSFVLQPAHPLGVTVRNHAGELVAGAEVRVYDRREPAVVSLGETDGLGRAVLAAPASAHVAVLAPGAVPVARWRFDFEVQPAGSELELTLPAARVVRGRVQGERGPLGGVVVIASEAGPEYLP